MNKFCKGCNSEKNVSEFYVRRNRGNGLAGYTHKYISCLRKTNREYNKSEGDFDKSEYNKMYREKHREKLNEYSKNWRINNVDKFKSGQKNIIKKIKRK